SADLPLLAALLLRGCRRFEAVEYRPVAVAAPCPTLDQLRRTVGRISLVFVPFPGIVHPLHPETADRDPVTDDYEVSDRIRPVRRGVAQDSAEHTLDPVGDVASALAERHRREEFTLEALVLLIMLVLARE